MASRRKRPSQAQVIERLQKVIPDLQRMEEVLGDDPAKRLAEAAQAQPGRGPAGEGDDTESEGFASTGQSALSALDKIRRDGTEADLTAPERENAEAIIELFGRPAILVQGGRFFAPEHPWEKLEDQREGIEESLRSVGRIEIDGHPALDWVGTGFLVADDVIITNRHVAKEFARQGPDLQWVFESGMTPRIDFAEEMGGAKPREFELTELIGISDAFDMAFMRVAQTGGADAGELPPRLPLAPASACESGREVYVIGYPASDSRRNDPEEQRRIFDGIFDVKRLQPGELDSVDPPASLCTHDCSTLGGNSGSCVIDLQTHQILGLHFSGRYLVANKAIALAHCGDDLIKKAGLEFA